MQDDVSSLSVRELLELHDKLSAELRRRDVIRSAHLVGDYAEHLACAALKLRIADKQQKGFDAVDLKGKRYQIKGRRKAAENRAELIQVKSLDFDFLVGILFQADFSVKRACLIPKSVFRRIASESSGSWRLRLLDLVWEAQGVRDITRQVKTASDRR